MIEPASPIVPGDEDGHVPPQAARRDGIYLVQRKLHPISDHVEAALKKLLDFVAAFMTEPSSGVRFDTVTAEGRLKIAGCID